MTPSRPSILEALALPTLDFSNWYAGRSILFVLWMAGIFVYAFYISLGGKRQYKVET